MSGEQTQIIRNYGFIPDHIFYPQLNLPSGPQSLSLDSLTRLFTSMFIHANFIHIAFNLFALAYLGVYAERAIGITRYVLVYVASGLTSPIHGAIASIFYIMEIVVLIGASRLFLAYLG